MRLSERNRKQTATRWIISGTDVYGASTWTRSSIKVRWEDKQIKTVDLSGADIISNSIVYTGIDLNVGDYLFLGSNVSDTPPEESFRVRNFRKTPNLSATDFMRKAIL